MAARILITGKGGKSGSWKIRAEQLGSAIGAEVVPMAELSEMRNADVIVVVKRTPGELIRSIRASGKPWVFDMVDCWPQPSDWDGEQSRAWLRETLSALSPTAVVFGTQQMRLDSEFAGCSMVMPHHSWQRYVDHQPVVRSRVQTVGYEGAEAYLGRWRRILAVECNKRGWDLMINGDMRTADVGVALRDGGGYPARWWKPGTKLSNLQALGIPALCNEEAGYRSVASGAEIWIQRAQDIADAFDMLDDVRARQAICTSMRDSMLPVSYVAKTYANWLATLAR